MMVCMYEVEWGGGGGGGGGECFCVRVGRGIQDLMPGRNWAKFSYRLGTSYKDIRCSPFGCPLF